MWLQRIVKIKKDDVNTTIRKHIGSGLTKWGHTKTLFQLFIC